jgi:hypothetical protein
MLTQGFNNEHPNAKRAAVMKKRDWVNAPAFLLRN